MTPTKTTAPRCAVMAPYRGWHSSSVSRFPGGVDGTQPGYAMFTWNSIGIIDVPSMIAITQEAWLRQPTTVTKIATLSARAQTPMNVIARYPEHLDVFAVANDGRVMSVWWDASSGWAGWFPVSGGVASSGGPGSPVTAVNRYSTHLDLFTVGTDNRPYSAWWDASSGWSGWFTLGSLQCRPGSTINVVSRYTDHLDLFTTASDGRTMSTWWDASSGWAADWFQVSGGVAASGAAVTADRPTSFASRRLHRRHGQQGLQLLVGRPLGVVPNGSPSTASRAVLIQSVNVIARYPDHLDLFTTASRRGNHVDLVGHTKRLGDPGSRSPAASRHRAHRSPPSLATRTRSTFS